jgi:WD40 repeat protein
LAAAGGLAETAVSIDPLPLSLSLSHTHTHTHKHTHTFCLLPSPLCCPLSQGHYFDISTVAFSPDGALIATGSEDRKVKVFQQVWAV